MMRDAIIGIMGGVIGCLLIEAYKRRKRKTRRWGQWK